MNASIKKIVLEVNGKKFELSCEEAKELKNILANLFGADSVQYVHHYERWPWTYWHTYPHLSRTLTAGLSSIGTISNVTTDTVYLCNASNSL